MQQPADAARPITSRYTMNNSAHGLNSPPMETPYKFINIHKEDVPSDSVSCETAQLIEINEDRPVNQALMGGASGFRDSFYLDVSNLLDEEIEFSPITGPIITKNKKSSNPFNEQFTSSLSIHQMTEIFEQANTVAARIALATEELNRRESITKDAAAAILKAVAAEEKQCRSLPSSPKLSSGSERPTRESKVVDKFSASLGPAVEFRYGADRDSAGAEGHGKQGNAAIKNSHLGSEGDGRLEMQKPTGGVLVKRSNSKVLSGKATVKGLNPSLAVANTSNTGTNKSNISRASSVRETSAAGSPNVEYGGNMKTGLIRKPSFSRNLPGLAPNRINAGTMGASRVSDGGYHGKSGEQATRQATNFTESNEASARQGTAGAKISRSTSARALPSGASGLPQPKTGLTRWESMVAGRGSTLQGGATRSNLDGSGAELNLSDNREQGAGAKLKYGRPGNSAASGACKFSDETGSVIGNKAEYKAAKMGNLSGNDLRYSTSERQNTSGTQQGKYDEPRGAECLSNTIQDPNSHGPGNPVIRKLGLVRPMRVTEEPNSSLNDSGNTARNSKQEKPKESGISTANTSLENAGRYRYGIPPASARVGKLGGENASGNVKGVASPANLRNRNGTEDGAKCVDGAKKCSDSTLSKFTAKFLSKK